MIIYLVQQTEDYHGPYVFSVHATVAGAQAEARRLATASGAVGDEDAATADWYQPTEDRWNLATERYREGRDMTWQVRAVTLQD